MERRCERWLEELYESYATPVHRYALRRVGRDAADEIVAETFVVAWRRFERVPDEPLPWLYAVARRLVANHRRSDNRRHALLTRLGDSASPGSDSPSDRGLRESLATLRDGDREALLLVAWEGLSTAELAVALGCTQVAARARLHRARTRLRAAMAENRDRPLREAREVCDGSAG
jgi:RNA polymerase sigma-70 factor (ECF subfamily)